jgi:hypothetical protein
VTRSENTTEKSDTCDTILLSFDEGELRMNRKNALRALKNLCTFIGAIALFSYFANWAVDLRHWYVTLASFLMCSILWLGFYMIEVRGGITRVASGLSRLRKSAEPPSPSAEVPALPADPPPVTAPNPLPWLNPHPSQAAIAGKESVRAAGK